MTDSQSKQKLILFFLGAWMFGTVLMWWVAAQNFYRADTLLSPQPPDKLVTAMQPDELRLILRYFASELNRQFFHVWEVLQLTLAAVVLILAFRRPSEDRLNQILLSAMGLLVLVFLFYLTPELVRQGTALDFVQTASDTPQANRFAVFHRLYVTGDVLKLAAGMWVSWRVMLRRGLTR